MTQESLSRHIQKIAQFLPMLLFACALYMVHQQLKQYDLSEILASLQNTRLDVISAAVLLMLLNYLVLAGYDWLALRFTGHGNIPLPKMIAAALLSYAISNNTGHAWAAGGSIRYRFYAKWGVPGWDILKISFFQAVTYLLGALTLGLVGSVLLPYYLTRAEQDPPAIHWVSLLCGAALIGYWAAVFLWRKPLLIKGFEVYLPTPSMTVWQTLVSSVDVVLSSLVLWLLLKGQIDIDFGAFLVVFVVAQVIGVFSQVPGGIGVFESAFLWLMSDIEASDQHLILIGALLLYRLIYYFVPLLLAGSGLLSYEVYSRRHLLIEGSAVAGRMLSAIVPQLYSLLLLLAGGMLLVSGAIPANADALSWLSDFLPLPVIEISHMAGSLIGLLLLFLARGIHLKIDVAWQGSMLLIGLGIFASLFKGLEWRAALLLLSIMLLLLPTRAHFQRHSSLLRMAFSKSWLATTMMVLGGCLWLGYFAHRNLEYANELWWQFSYDGSAPRFLRAWLLLAIVIVCYGLWRVLSIAAPYPFVKPSATELDQAQCLLSHAEHTQGFLALLGDKCLFWNPEHTAFVMFATTPQFWIAMGDPVGDAAAMENLLYRFQEQADQFGAKIVFYQVSPQCLPLYLDLGLSFFKLGEEARVDLSQFSLQGKLRETQRGAINKFGKLGYEFEILSGTAVKQAMPTLRQISAAWVMQKNTREKGFSLGFFNEDYLLRTGIAVVKDPAGRIKAFANLWQTAGRQELSMDLMRYDPDSPKGIMDFLFAELMLWGKAESYQWFSLGMAPLAGLERRPLSPIWHKVGAAIFEMGDRFYNFEGLYDYKAKFAPQWQPRYLAAPAGLSVPFILMSITRLISGGWQGVFSK
ncbi:MAG: bifunctional lysylphosphatidylglycerol flippase/synthetase MprF [Methylomonas sp.]|jgi:phosphatidylglycerol lysyltransferase|uniref:bifunctional lysylphosphatidylglycerol flippase/synthetase MprF n=1 Tax=Methylomonas sp. TaxID=418 RepID=UPI0025E19072|nr:bifunctional lysylphosphatidylglycerol flippase/synthetase MprF [Methylomonas sp.]MCK9608259.1 bifunctional lysylphosphatidylglycerol flippase/synthetase MprF [Methylomonas sp.]